MSAWTRESVRHALSVLRYGRNPAATVYESLGTDFFLALAPGWLNLGLWEGDGSDPQEAAVAVRRLVGRLASPLPSGGDVLDVGNGLGTQDPLIAEVVRPRRLVALNITRSQLVAGRDRLAAARALAMCADATRLPFADGAFDGVISVEAAFHFPSRARFFAEAFRVLRPGGVLSMSDVATRRMPRSPREVLAGVTMLRAWGLRTEAAASAGRIAALASLAGFEDLRVDAVGERVIGPALRFVRSRLEGARGEVPRSYELACRAMLAQAELLWRRGLLDYVLLSAVRPAD